MGSPRAKTTGHLGTGGRRYDVAVVGAGAAGMSAAIAAARAGARVALIDANPGPGGTVGFALIHTLGGIYDADAEPLNDGQIVELTERLRQASPLTTPRRIGKLWVLGVCPEVYCHAVAQWIGEHENVDSIYHARLTDVATRAGRIESMTICGGEETRQIAARAVVDCSGTGEVVRRVDRGLLLDDDRRAAGGLVIQLRGVEPGALVFPKGIRVVRALRAAAAEGDLPALCGHAWIDSGVYEDEAYVKLFVPMLGDWRERESRGEITRSALAIQAQVVAFLARFPAFADARVARTGQLGIRDGGRVRGEYYLTEEDVKAGRTFADAVCRCTWPIEYWDPVEGLDLEYLDRDRFYEVPLRCLKVADVENLWAAGKCLSADHRAQASARVVGSCWAMGEAAGRAAANYS